MLNRRYYDKEKEVFRKSLIEKLNKLGWEAQNINGNIITVCNNPQVALVAHYDTGRITPWPVKLYYRIFGCQARRYLPVIYVVFLTVTACLTIYISFIGILALICLLVLFFQMGPTPYNQNDNTSGISLLLKIAGFPDLKDKVRLIFTDNEERGRKGAKNISNMVPELVLNFDCIGAGDILIISTNKIDPPEQLLKHLKNYKIIRQFSNSDYLEFKNGIGFTVAKKGLYGYYIPNSHTKKDTFIDEEILLRLADKIKNYIDANCINKQMS